MRPIALASLAALGALAVSAAGADTLEMTYSCERGVQVPVVYVNPAAPDDPSLAILHVEGQLVALEIAVSGSGARYAGPEAESHYVWWSHQGTAMLMWVDAATGDETTLLTDCAEPE